MYLLVDAADSFAAIYALVKKSIKAWRASKSEISMGQRAASCTTPATGARAYPSRNAKISHILTYWKNIRSGITSGISTLLVKSSGRIIIHLFPAAPRRLSPAQ